MHYVKACSSCDMSLAQSVSPCPSLSHIFSHSTARDTVSNQLQFLSLWGSDKVPPKCQIHVQLVDEHTCTWSITWKKKPVCLPVPHDYLCMWQCVCFVLVQMFIKRDGSVQGPLWPKDIREIVKKKFFTVRWCHTMSEILVSFPTSHACRGPWNNY